MKLCTCNHCGEIYEDMNPQVNAPDYPEISALPLMKFYVDANDLSTGYWGCPECCTDAYLTDKVDLSLRWELTDPNTQQWGRRLSTYKYEFKESGRKNEIIDLEKYTWKEICDCCEAYYPNMNELFAQYGAQSGWIIAECLFEMNIIKS